MIPKSWEDIAAMVVLATATIGAVTWLWNRRRHFRGMLRGIAATRQRGYQRLHSWMLIRLSRIAICFAPGQYLLHLAELIYSDFPGLKDSETSIQLAIALSFLGHVDEATKINLVGAAYGRWYADDPSQAIQLLENSRRRILVRRR
jgi:hypothetical protein